MLGARLIRVLVIAPAVPVVTLAQLNLPSAQFWHGLRPVLYVAVGLCLLATVHELGSFVSYFGHLGALRSYDQDVRALLSATLSRVEAGTGIDWRSVGVSAYCLRGVPWRRRLIMIDELRLGSGPMPGQPPLRPGKGVVGVACKRSEGVCSNWEDYVKVSIAMGRQRWERQDKEARFGLTWGELLRTESLTWVSAFPVYSRTAKLVGVVAVDAPTDLSGADVSRVIRDLAASMGDVGSPPRSWWSYVGRRNG
ncbi:hypothetical protein [Saccharothrix syringae]|uniref:GAF domain-containing protein n=1 Tax=Saccharothrix syringae TaxID=103733 RepID=A0A5Q0GWZ2_SACSY|nr:hypothetical protein [Saccharothrix syringae]QFZ18468.1 hypothetical protein EKG83_14155 [Saccharothrix syringae]